MLYGGAHWRHLTITIKSSVCGGVAALLSNYCESDHFVLLLEPYDHRDEPLVISATAVDVY